jgi:hypothetical protein
VKNIGASIFDYYGIGIYVVGEVFNFSSKTFEVYKTFGSNLESPYGLLSGDSVDLPFSVDYTHPHGFIRFRCNTHFNYPDGQKESNTTNNNRSQIFYHPKYLIWIPLCSFAFNMLIILRYIFWQLF